jgi:hypothetical protein
LDDSIYRILSSYWLVHFYLMKESAKVFVLFFVWIAGCLNSSDIPLMSLNPKNNCCLTLIFGARFGGKDCGLCPYKPYAE